MNEQDSYGSADTTNWCEQEVGAGTARPTTILVRVAPGDDGAAPQARPVHEYLPQALRLVIIGGERALPERGVMLEPQLKEMVNLVNAPFLAKERGIKGFKSDVLASNKGMLKVFEKGGHQIKAELDYGSYSLTIPFYRSAP